LSQIRLKSFSYIKTFRLKLNAKHLSAANA
jgi:hypothetical protein